MRAVLAFSAGLVVALMLSAGRADDSQGQEPVPKEIALLEITAPAGTQVLVDGGDYTGKTEGNLYLGSETEREVTAVARYPGGGGLTKKVRVQGSKRTALDLRWAAERGPQLMLQMGHQSSVHAVAFSHDGRYVLTGSYAEAIVWDAQTGKEIRTIPRYGTLTAVAFSPNGREILGTLNSRGRMGSSTSAAVLWDLQSGEQIRMFSGGRAGIASVMLTPNGRQLRAWSGGNNYLVWDSKTGEQTRTIPGGPETVTAVALSSSGEQVLAGLDDGAVVLRDFETGKQISTFKGHTASIHSVAFSFDGRRVLTGSKDGTAILWDKETAEPIHAFTGHTGEITSVAFSHDGRQAITGSEDRTAIVWSTQTGAKVRTLTGHAEAVHAVAFSPDDRQILTGSADTVLWDTATGKKIRTFARHLLSPVKSVAVSSDKSEMLIASADHAAILWSAEKGTKVRTLAGHTDIVNTAIFSPAGRQILTGSADKTAILWDKETGKKIRTLSGHSESVTCLAFSHDGRQMLTGAQDRRAILWDARTGERVSTLIGDSGAYSNNDMNSVAFSQDGRYALANIHGGMEAILWDARTGETLRRINEGSESVGSGPPYLFGRDTLPAFTQINGCVDAVCERLFLRDMRTAEKVQTFEGHSGWIASAVLNPDATRVLTASSDRTAALWNARTGERIRTFAGHLDKVNSAVFSPDEKLVVTASDDGTVRFWNVASGEEVARLISFDGANDWLIVTPDGLFDGSEGGQKIVGFRDPNDPMKVLPAEQGFRAYYRPGLLADILAGHAVTAPVPSHREASKPDR